MDWFLYDNGLRHERVKQENQRKLMQQHDQNFPDKENPLQNKGKTVAKSKSKSTRLRALYCQESK